MEQKKINKKFYFLSAINTIPVVIFGRGNALDTLVLAAALIILILNHTILVNIVKSVTAVEGDNAQRRAVGHILMLLGFKFLLLFGLIGLIYFYKKELVIKLFGIIFFQLIIQVVSIKNNYQN